MPKYTEFTAGEGDDESVVEARTSEGDETVNTTAGPRNVVKGEIVVKTGNPNMFDVHSADSWKDTGYPDKAATPTDEDKGTRRRTPTPTPAPTPATHRDGL